MSHTDFTFSQVMMYLREKHGLSKGQLARAAYLSRVYIHHLERGMRQNPSTRAVHNIAQALMLQESEREDLYAAFTRLTGNVVSEDSMEQQLFQERNLAHLLVSHSPYPAHLLDRLWYVQLWNEAAQTLFEVPPENLRDERIHLLELVFGTHRSHFLAWESLAQRLVNDFLYTTHALTHLPAYKDIWRRLSSLPDFRRIAAARPAQVTPAFSFVFSLHHSQLGRLTLHTAPTVFTRRKNYCTVSYLPVDQPTLSVYRKSLWLLDTLPPSSCPLSLSDASRHK